MALEKPDTRGLLRRLFPPGSPQRLELVRAAWPLAVGVDLARRTEVLGLDGRTLRVRVPDAGWRKVLHRMRWQILGRLAEVAGDAAPDRMGFQEEPFATPTALPPRALAPPPVPPATAPASVVQGAEAIADPELRRAFVEMAARYLARSGRVPAENDHA